MIAEKNLTEIYFIIRQKPGWLADCVNAGYTPEEIRFLEELDVQLCGYQPERDANKWADEVMADGGPDILSAETDEEKIKIVSKAIADFYDDMATATRGSWSYADVKIHQSRLDRLIRLRNKFRARQVHRDQPDSNSLPEWKIVKARKHPLHLLIGCEERERVPCPFHGGEHKNFSVKNGWGYCYTCNESCDSIKWLMTQQGFSFKEAVEKLQV